MSLMLKLRYGRRGGMVLEWDGNSRIGSNGASDSVILRGTDAIRTGILLGRDFRVGAGGGWHSSFVKRKDAIRVGLLGWALVHVLSGWDGAAELDGAPSVHLLLLLLRLSIVAVVKKINSGGHIIMLLGFWGFFAFWKANLW